MPADGPLIGIPPRTVAAALGAAAAVMVAATVAGKLLRDVMDVGGTYVLLRPFDVNGEGNVWTWFSSAIHLLISAMCGYIALRRRRARARFATHWAVLSVLFLVVSVDETAALHEEAIVPLRDLLGTSGLLYNAWVVPAFLLLAILAVAYLPWLRHLPNRVARLIVGAAALFVGGGAGVELLTGDYKEAHGTEGFTFGVLTAVEESLEIAGLILFVYALLVFLAIENHGREAG